MESPRSGEYPLIKFSEKDLNNSEIIANLNSHLLTVLNVTLPNTMIIYH